MQEPDRDFTDLSRRYGRRAAIEIWKELASATRNLSRTIRTLKMDCDFRARDSIYFANDGRGLRKLQREFRDRKRAGLPGRWLSGERLRDTAGINGAGAIVTSGNAEVNPVKACHGFLKAAAHLGARIFEQSPARGVSRTNGGVIIRGGTGAVRARQVLVATGYATTTFKPLLGRFKLKDTYVIATGRMKGSSKRGALRARAMAWDTTRPYHYLRWSPDHRLLVGGGDTTHHGVAGSAKRIARAAAELGEYLGRVHPQLEGERLAYAWEGLFAETVDGLPYIGTHSRFPRHLFALGYGGNGMTASFLAVMLLLHRYRTGTPHPAERLFSFSRTRRRE
jgi:glycine/D-amino acid oxidase-like deaminating enzyme